MRAILMKNDVAVERWSVHSQGDLFRGHPRPLLELVEHVNNGMQLLRMSETERYRYVRTLPSGDWEFQYVEEAT